MSSLLEEAIVDAAALKEAALKNAEASVLEKYSTEVRSAITTLLEQDELGGELGGEMGMDMGADLGAPVPAGSAGKLDSSFMKDLPLAFQTEELDGPPENELIEIDFDALKARIAEEEEAGVEPEPAELLEAEAVAEELDEAQGGDSSFYTEPIGDTEEKAAEEGEEGGPKGEQVADDEAEASMGIKDPAVTSEDVELDEDLLNAIVEELVVDMVPRPQGWSSLGSADNSIEQANNDAMAAAMAAHGEPLEEEEEDLSTAPDVVSDDAFFESKNRDLKKTNNDLRLLLKEAKYQLTKMNLANAKLVYQNKALSSSSLNERQTNRIVEAVRNAKSVEEAKVIFETVESTVGAAIDHRTRPQSLREAVTRPTSVLLSSRKSEATYDPNVDRMLRLAGLKKQ
jgi:hypothetical protein